MPLFDGVFHYISVASSPRALRFHVAADFDFGLFARVVMFFSEAFNFSWNKHSKQCTMACTEKTKGWLWCYSRAQSANPVTFGKEEARPKLSRLLSRRQTRKNDDCSRNFREDWYQKICKFLRANMAPILKWCCRLLLYSHLQDEEWVGFRPIDQSHGKLRKLVYVTFRF